MDIRVSIIICTQDRAQSLDETLQSLARIRVPPHYAVELLVADNASRDETRLTVERSHFPNGIRVRYLFEPRKGKSKAQNLALRNAVGDILLFTDDDVRFPENWLEGMCQPIAEERAMLVQGGITPAKHLARPWLAKSFLAVSATVDLPSLPSRPSQFIGANMAFHKLVQEKVGGFDPVFGPGSQGGFCDDILFGEMAREAGFEACYAQCSIEHHFDPSRLTPHNVLDVARRLGRSYALLDYHWRHDDSNASRLRGLLVWAKLRVRSLSISKDTDRVPEWQYWYERELAYQTQMARLAGTPRRYSHRATAARLD